ncbi:MAG: DUF2125 domain-containing protein [Terricaulis sp.]
MKRFGWLLIPWLLFGAVVAGWLIYWNVVAGTAEARINTWIAQQNAGGAQISIQHITRHGFPVLMRLEIDGISYKPARGGWELQTSRADLNIEMLNTEHIILQPRSPISITHGGAVTNVTARVLLLSVRTQAGKLAVAGVESDDLTLDDPAQPGVLTIKKMVANVQHDPRAAGDFMLAFDASGVHLPRPVRSFESFGLDMPAVHARIVVKQGAALLQSAQGDPLGPWRDAGGKLVFDGLGLQWGPLTTTGTGEGGLDEQRRLSGRLVLPIEHPASVLTALADSPVVDQSARQAMQMLAASYVVNGHALTLDVGAQDGVLTLEGLRVRTLPPVY